MIFGVPKKKCHAMWHFFRLPRWSGVGDTKPVVAANHVVISSVMPLAKSLHRRSRITHFSIMTLV